MRPSSDYWQTQLSTCMSHRADDNATHRHDPLHRRLHTSIAWGATVQPAETMRNYDVRASVSIATPHTTKTLADAHQAAH